MKSMWRFAWVIPTYVVLTFPLMVRNMLDFIDNKKSGRVFWLNFNCCFNVWFLRVGRMAMWVRRHHLHSLRSAWRATSISR